MGMMLGKGVVPLTKPTDKWVIHIRLLESRAFLSAVLLCSSLLFSALLRTLILH
jgi:hypothetical protein